MIGRGENKRQILDIETKQTNKIPQNKALGNSLHLCSYKAYHLNPF